MTLEKVGCMRINGKSMLKYINIFFLLNVAYTPTSLYAIEKVDELRVLIGKQYSPSHKAFIGFSKRERLPAHSPGEYDTYIYDQSGEVRLLIEGGTVTHVQVLSDKTLPNIEFNIGNEYCKMIKDNLSLTFEYDFDHGAQARLVDNKIGIVYWFNGENYLYELAMDGDIQKNNPSLCGMKVHRIEVLVQ